MAMHGMRITLYLYIKGEVNDKRNSSFLQSFCSRVILLEVFDRFTRMTSGECRLENMRTLCVTCHADVTATQYTERRLTRLEAKKKLKAVMSNLKTINKPKQKVDEPEGSRHSDVEENKDEDELIVNVPGSAYSISTASQERGNSELETSASNVLDEARHNDVLHSAQSLPQS